MADYSKVDTAFETLYNYRCLSTATTTTSAIARGRIARCCNPFTASWDDVQRLVDGLGTRTVMDLRDAKEAETVEDNGGLLYRFAIADEYGDTEAAEFIAAEGVSSCSGSSCSAGCPSCCAAASNQSASASATPYRSILHCNLISRGASARGCGRLRGRVPNRLRLSLSLSLSLYPSIYLSVYPSIYPSIHLSHGVGIMGGSAPETIP